MELNVQDWQEFTVGKIFTLLNGKGITKEEIECNWGDLPAIQSGEENNGVLGKISEAYCEEMNYTMTRKECLTVARTGSAGFVSYQGEGCVVGDSAKILLLDDEVANVYVYLFLQTMLTANRFKYDYGRKVTELKYLEDVLRLPVQMDDYGNPIIDDGKKYSEKGYIPDWKFMEEYIKSLHCKPITTAVAVDSSLDLNIEKWEEFKVSDIFEVKYGINMELNTCDETTSNDPEGIAFVARTADNNGVSAYVKRIDGKEPQPAETITVAGGGSVLSTFVQKRPFYSGRDLYLLLPKEDINLNMKIFIATVLYSNQYRYSYGRQANKTLPSLLLKLPIQRNGDGNPIIDEKKKYSPKGFIPDWKFMDEYIKSLPYSDRI